jgi:hypothetical protein
VGQELRHLVVRQGRHGQFDGAGRAAARPFGLLALGHPLGGHHPYVEALDPAYGEGEHLGGRLVEPLEAVEDQQHGAGGGEGAQHVENGDADREPVPVAVRFSPRNRAARNATWGSGAKAARQLSGTRANRSTRPANGSRASSSAGEQCNTVPDGWT